MSRSLLSVFFALCFFWGILFAKSFLNTPKHTPRLDRVLTGFMALAVVSAILFPFLDLHWRDVLAYLMSLIIPPVFIATAAVCWRRGFQPAHFFLIAFFCVASATVIGGLAFFALVPYSFLTIFSTQIGSAFEVILLQLALADRINTLQREQNKIRHALTLASEVQQNLLPKMDPQIQGLDIAGRSTYCDETGGDHYDYLLHEPSVNGRIGLVVGDVSGHGISSALLMASARAFLRQRSAMPGSAAEVVSDVNRQIALDVEESGQFLTLFYCEIDVREKNIRWVSAGHDPAIVYDRESNSFTELAGRGLALGIFSEFVYETHERRMKPGQIVLIGTDGIWESHNQRGEMFGKERLKAVIHDHSHKTAEEIVDAVIREVKNFSYPRELEDDVTLVVVRVDGSAPKMLDG